jgi:hypothetical protein
MDVRLIGEGGVQWTFSLPLKEPYADQVKARKLSPADAESEAALAELLADAAEPTLELAPGDPEPETIDSLLKANNRIELNDLASARGVTEPEKLGSKRDVAQAIIDATPAEGDEDEDDG